MSATYHTSRILAGVLTALLLVTAAFAAPPKKGSDKKPAKEDTKALIALGKKVYEKHACGACHVIAGKGTNAGPELTKIGADKKHTLKWLEEAIIDPKKHKPDGTMPSYKESIKGKDLKGLVAYMASLK
jgi:mono/diheme cytochrome c family protein